MLSYCFLGYRIIGVPYFLIYTFDFIFFFNNDLLLLLLLSLILKKQAHHNLAKSIIFSVSVFTSCSFRYWTHRRWTPAKRRQSGSNGSNSMKPPGCTGLNLWWPSQKGSMGWGKPSCYFIITWHMEWLPWHQVLVGNRLINTSVPPRAGNWQITFKSIDCLRSMKLGFFCWNPNSSAGLHSSTGDPAIFNDWRPNRASITPEFRGFVFGFLL